MSTTMEVTQEDLCALLNAFGKKAYETGSCEEGSLEADVTKKCESLFKLDYTIVELDNTDGNLCPRYPSRIFIPEYAHGHVSQNLTSNNANTITNDTCASDNANTITTTYENGRITPTLTSNNANTLNTNAANVTPPSSRSRRDSDLGSSSSTEDACPLPNGNKSNVTFANTLVDSQQNLPNAQHPLPLSSTTNVPTSNARVNITGNNTIYEELTDISKVKELTARAKYARCRQRFAVPVIYYRGKYVCRSATVSINAETFGRQAIALALEYFSGKTKSEPSPTPTPTPTPSTDEENNDKGEESLLLSLLPSLLPVFFNFTASQFSYDEVIKNDIQLLNALNVSSIVDLMVEQRKIKYHMYVSSSEKADQKNNYENFNIYSMPYPGCEFFKKFHDNNFLAENLSYNWEDSINDAPISIPSSSFAHEMNINWNEYKNWDVICLTQNYLKVCLKHLQDENAGLLVHCISGWDRTPLFISLLRMSLWADGLIHQSLNPIQMTYLTVAYDWYLFGHQLPDRLKKKEDIMLFCFHVLKYITQEDFSVIEKRKRTKTVSSSGGSSMTTRSDEEEPRDELVDHESNESFSLCDLSITDHSTSTTPPTSPLPSRTLTNSPNRAGSHTVHNNIVYRSPRQKTSPISVPGAGRQRNESTSSTESFLFITNTGSVDSMKNGSCMTNFANNANDNCSNAPDSENSSNSTHPNETNNSNGGDALPSTSTNTSVSNRKQRLDALRAIFVNSYGRSVGLQFREGSASFVATLTELVYSS